MRNLITLTTDFGAGSCYAAAMKGVMYSTDPDIKLVDLTHDIPPQDLQHTAYFLQATALYFPPNTLHVVVVDPGVGSERAILYVELNQQRLLVPDNGCWTGLIDNAPPHRVLRLTESTYWREEISATFHGRDIFAPVAGHLSLGVDPAQMGEEVQSWVSLDLPQPKYFDNEIQGEVVFIDEFGNLLTNIPGEILRRWDGKPLQITVGENEIRTRVHTYSESPKDNPCALLSSMNTLEIAVNHGNAAKHFGAEIGTPICIRLRDS